MRNGFSYLDANCFGCHENTLVRQLLLDLMDIGPGVRFKSSSRREDPDPDREEAERIRAARAMWATSTEIPQDADSPARLWLKKKAGYRGRMGLEGQKRVWIGEPAIRWNNQPLENGAVGCVVGLLAKPDEWAEAYPDLPEGTAVQRIAIRADGSQEARGIFVGADKDTNERIYVGKASKGLMSGRVIRIGYQPGEHTVRICEGLADALAVRARWRQETWAACGTSGFYNEGIAKALSKYAETIIHADAGEAGEKAAKRLKSRIEKAGGYAIIVAPATGDDPADAFGDITGVPYEEPKQPKIDWGVTLASHEWRVVDAPSRVRSDGQGSEHSEQETDFSGVRHGDNDVPNSRKNRLTISKPLRPEDMFCTEPYKNTWNDPQGDDCFGPRDCKKCVNCRRWWKFLSGERYRMAGGSKFLLTVHCDDPQQAADWRGRLSNRIHGKDIRIINPAERGTTLSVVYCHEVTGDEIQKTETFLEKKGMRGTFVRKEMTSEEYDALLPYTKRIETDDGGHVDTVSYSSTMPVFRKEATDYWQGNTEPLDEYMAPEDITPKSAAYLRREAYGTEHRAVLNASDRMTREGMDLYRELFLEYVGMIKSGDIRNGTELKEELNHDCKEYGGSARLIFDCAQWYAGKAQQYRWAYGPVLLALDMIPEDILKEMGVEIPPPPPCMRCGSRMCAC